MKDLLHIKDWTIDEYHRPSYVCCDEPSIINKYHYVFTLQREHMRERPIRFDQFRNTDAAQNMQRCFHFFLDFIQEMVCSKTKEAPEPGKNTLAFVEWCPRSHSKTERDVAGWRIHVFVDRGVGEMAVLKKYLAGFEKKIQKCERKRCLVPEHYKISSLTKYGTDIYATYSGTTCNVEELYQGIENGSTSLPSALFKAKELAGSIYSLDEYKDEGNAFIFPGTEFLRIDPEMISVKEFAKRQLPDYVLFNFVKPEMRIDREAETIDFLAHRDYQHLDLDFSTVDEFIKTRGNDWIIYEPGPTRDVFEIGEVTYSKALHAGDVWLHHQNLDDLEGEASELYETIRANQADLSIIDCIHIMSKTKEESERPKYLEEEFLTHVWNDEDCVESTPLKSVIRWFHKEYNHALLKPIKLVHKDMSVMGHRACFLMYTYTHLYQVASAHRSFYWVHVARLDGFRHTWGLHLNACFTGDAATSKSYTLSELQKNSISNTTSMRTYDTDKADAIDSDKNHVVSMFDEAPPGFFKDPKKKGPLEALKQRLTMMKTTHRRLFTREDTGERQQIESTSSNIGCLFGATNEPRSSFDPALQTRFHFFEAERSLKTTRSIADCQHNAKTMQKANKEKKKEWVMFHKFEQAFVAIAWQFIRLGRIKPPDISVFTIVLKRFEKILKQNYGKEIPPRTAERMEYLCVNLAIVRAKQIMYFTETGECANVPFHPSHILLAEKYMICTEELAVHAIGLEFDTIVSRNERRLLKKIWEMHDDNEEYKQDDQGNEDFNYLALNGNIHSISRKLLNSLQEDSIHISTCNIETILREFMDKTIDSYVYSPVCDTFKDGKPGYDKTHTGKFIAAEALGGRLYLHLDLFKEVRLTDEEVNIYKACVEKLAHEYTRTKLFVLGLNSYETDEPDVWDTLLMQPKNGEILQVSRGIGKHYDPYGILALNQDIVEDIDMDLDQYAAMQRAEDCGYKIEPYQTNPNDWSYENEAYPWRQNKRKR